MTIIDELRIEKMREALREIIALSDNDYVNRHASIWRVAKKALYYVDEDGDT